MKLFRFLLLISCCHVIASAQTELMPIPFALPAYGSMLDRDFAFVVHDSAILALYNPARAAQGRFVYWSYYPAGLASFPGRALAVTSLLSDHESSWILQAIHTLYQRSDFSESTDAAMAVYPWNPSVVSNTTPKGSFDSREWNNRLALRLVRSQPMTDGRWSGGVFFSANGNGSRVDQYTSSTIADRHTAGSYYRYSSAGSSSRLTENETPEYIAGLEISRFLRGEDLRALAYVSWSPGSARSTERSVSTSATVDSALADFSSGRSDLSDARFSSDKTLRGGVQIALHRPAAYITDTDDYFFGLAVTGRSESESDEENRLLNRTLPGGVTSFRENGSGSSSTFGIAFSGGYLLHRSMSDLELTIGAAAGSSYSYTSSANEYSMTQTISTPQEQAEHWEITRHGINIQLRIPVLVEFSPAPWITLRGGLQETIPYTWSTTSSDLRSTQSGPVTRTSHTSTNGGWVNTYQSTFLTCVLRHREGLALQIGFRGDLSVYDSWDLSLGYHF